MSRTVRLHPDAATDLNHAIAWYESRSPGLGQAVLVELRRMTQRLCLFPEAYRQIRPGVRQASLTRLPLSVIYSLTPDDIVILMIPDPRRDPMTLSQRLEDRLGSSRE